MSAATETPTAVVGGGVLGLSVAAALAERGRPVILLERGELGGVAGAASFAWANAVAADGEYRDLRVRALKRHVAHPADSPDGWFVALPAHTADATIEEGGYVDVGRFARAHADRIRAAGGLVRTGADVRHVRDTTAGAELELSSGERLRASAVVVCAGVGTPAVLGRDVPALAGIAGDRGFLVRVRSEAARDRMTMSDELNVRPDGPGVLVLQSLAVERQLAAEGVPADTLTAWPRLREIAAAHGIDLADGDLIGVHEAARPVPADGLPVVGWVSRSRYVIVTHSGMTLAPLLGELAAAELEGTAQVALEPYRPHRNPPTSSREGASA